MKYNIIFVDKDPAYNGTTFKSAATSKAREYDSIEDAHDDADKESLKSFVGDYKVVEQK